MGVPLDYSIRSVEHKEYWLLNKLFCTALVSAEVPSEVQEQTDINVSVQCLKEGMADYPAIAMPQH